MDLPIRGCESGPTASRNTHHLRISRAQIGNKFSVVQQRVSGRLHFGFSRLWDAAFNFTLTCEPFSGLSASDTTFVQTRSPSLRSGWRRSSASRSIATPVA